MQTPPKLFIPGPVTVRPEILDAMNQPMIGHRTPEFSALYQEVVAGVQTVLQTENRVYLSTSSATGLMEAAVRNTVKNRCLNLVCGAFSLRWHHITDACGFKSDAVGIEWGDAINPEHVEMALDEADYDVVTIVHNETSTGVMNPLKGITEVIRDNSDALILVDTVSSMSGVNIPVDDWGIDIALASVQKAWGLPPGFAVMSISDRALERSKDQPNKGYYFDFEVFEKYHQRGQTPSTPSLPHMYGLQRQLDRIGDEGLLNRFDRHKSMAARTREWALNHGFDIFAEEPYQSHTLTCIENTLDVDIAELSSQLLERGFRISNGYGPLKGKTFRIAHMADTQPDDLEELLGQLDEILA
ncbi:MAG: Serine-pyruvate aminotransferase [Candidatus Marinimicrobia bacterium]|nr:Serine-pyruvate aminotransferase [Candidatus Neomarinimicrobiota bacterium]